MSTLQLLLDRIVQDINQTLSPFEEKVEEFEDLLNAAFELKEISKESESKRQEAEEFLQKASKALEEGLKDCKQETSKNYSNQLIEALKVANSEGSDTNPIYLGEIEKSKGISILHLAAYGFLGDDIGEILSYLKPENIKRGSGLKIESELMIAVTEKNVPIRDWLLENNPDLMYQKASGSSALHIACMVNDYNTTERLIKRVAKEKGVDAVKEFVNAVNKYGCTPLYDALILQSERVYTLDSQKMLKFLDLFIENGVDLGKKILGDHTGEYVIFNSILNCPFLQDFDLTTAAIKMLNSGQDIKIDFNKIDYKLFTNEGNIEKILSLEDYDTDQKSTALNKIKEALVDYQKHSLKTNEIVDNTIHNIEQILVSLTGPDIDLGNMESDIAHLNMTDNDHNTQVAGQIHDDDPIEV